ncbi:MAG: heparinase II/III family protein, partial [Clostridiaceae bacterium]
MKERLRIFVLPFALLYFLATLCIPGIGFAEESNAGSEPVVIYCDNELLEFSQPGSVVKINEIYFAPAAELASLSGWNAQIGADPLNPGIMEFSNGILDLHVTAMIGQNVIYINGNERTISAAPELIDGVAMFPVQDFFYMMNCSVKWDKINSRFTVKSPLARVFTEKDIIIQKARTAPVLDGAADDAAWARAEQNGDFTTVFYNAEPKSGTQFKVTYDDEALYFFINCEGKPVPLEGMSIVLAPSETIGSDTPYFNAVLIPEPDNTTVAYDGRDRFGGIRIQYGGGSQEYTLTKGNGFDAVYNVNDTSWTAEVKIPYDKLVTSSGAAPAPSNAAEWRFNIIRVRPFTEGASSWVPIRNSIYGDNLIVGDCSYIVTFFYTPTTNRTGSIFFEDYPETSVFDNNSMPYLSAFPRNAGLRYMGYDTKLVYFDNEDDLNVTKTRFYAEWINQLGARSKAEILKVTEKDSRLYFIVKHPAMPSDGLFRLNIYADKINGNGNGNGNGHGYGKIIGKGNMIKKYEMMFDRQQVMDAGVIYNSFAVNFAVSNKTILEDKSESEISDAAKALIRIMPETIGYALNGSPAAGSLSYDAATDSLIQTSNGVVTLEVTRTLNDDGTYTYTTTPDEYKNNGSMILTSRTGKQVTFGYYEDASGKRYLLDAQLNGKAEDYIKGQLPSLVKTDPLGAAYVLYELAKAYQDWMPKFDYYNNAAPVEWDWGPPFGHFGALFNRWNFEELDDLKYYGPIYASLKVTNALDIVSGHMGEDAETLITEGMFNNDVEFFNMFPNQNQNMNYKSWQGLVALGKATGNPDYVHQAINMVDEYARNGFLLDGFWKEVTLSYHTQSLGGINDTMNLYLKGWSDPAGYISPRTGINAQNLDMGNLYPVLNASNLIQSTVVYPSGRWFPVQDTWESGKSTPTNLGSILMPAANIARMSKGTGTSTSQLYMTYLPQYGAHCHYDPLSLALWSNGQELLPDLGYTHSQLKPWAVSSLAHNTVVVDSKDSTQPASAPYGGTVENYADIDNMVQIMKVSEENAYPGITDKYDREPWYIKMEGSNDSYVLDIFRVDGGNRHEYTLNGDATSKTSSFTANVPMTDYNTDPNAANNDKGRLLPEGTVVTLPTSETDPGSSVYNGENLYYAYASVQDVKEAMLPDGKYEITMTTNNGTKNTAGMKITGFAGDNSELFIGKAPSLSGLTTAAGIQTPKIYMPKMVVRREGTDLQSTFINVMEPYAAGSAAKITSVEKLGTTNPEDVAMKVTYPCSFLADSTISDVIISNSNPSVALTVGDITLNGKMAFVRYLDDQVAGIYTVEADSVVVNGQSYAGGNKFEGKIVQTMRKAEKANMDAFIVNTAVPDTTVGKTITITHPDGSVHAFTVASVTPQGENTIIEVTGGDPGFDLFEDGSSKLLFYPQTSWKGDHTFKIAMETAFDTGIIVHRTKQGTTYYTSTERQNAINNINQGYLWAVDAKNSAVASADIYAQMPFEDLWNMVTPESINNDMGAALQSLTDAYLYTGDVKYGEAGLILLDRIADIYPDMQFAGTIAECVLEQTLVKAYDAFYPAVGSSAVKAFLSGKAKAIGLKNPKLYSDWICKNIEDNILRQVRVLSENPLMATNFGAQQAALALAAVVLDNPSETTEWLDFVFRTGGLADGKVTGGNISAWLVNNVDRDGMAGEVSPAYNMLWVDSLEQIADALDGYASYTKVNLYTDPAFGKMLSSFFPLTAVGKYTIPIGDSNGTGILVDIDRAVKYFEKTGDPIYAQYVYYLNNSSSFGLHSGIFTENPGNIAGSIASSIIANGTLKLNSSVMPGYGFSILRDGSTALDVTTYASSFKDPTAPIMPTLIPGTGTKISTFANGAVQLDPTSGTLLPGGATLTSTFKIPADGYYSIDIKPYTAGSYGIFDIYVDGIKTAQFDFYGSMGVNSPLVTIAQGNYTEGDHELKFVLVGKNPKASRNKMGLMSINLYKYTFGDDTQRDIWMYYGSTQSQYSHKDQLNLGLHEYGLDLAPDLGSQPDKDWASSTLSHNTVVVDNSSQLPADGGNLLHFDDSGNVQVMDVEANDAYQQTEMYRRSVVTIKVSDKDSYNVDFFRVKGGTDQTYSFHSTAGTVSTEGLNLVPQTTGASYQWLENERKDAAPSGSFSVDYDIADELSAADIHLRMTMLGEYNDVTVATGYAPNNGSAQSMEYVLAHANTTGSSLECVFTSVIEPYKDSRYIQSIEEAVVTKDGKPVSDMEARAIRVTLVNGRIDYIVSALDNTVIYNIDGKFNFCGIMGVYSEMNGT